MMTIWDNFHMLFKILYIWQQGVITPCWQIYIFSWHWAVASSIWKLECLCAEMKTMNNHDLLGYRQTIISNTTLNPLQPSHALTLSSEHYKISGIGYISIVIWNDVCTHIAIGWVGTATHTLFTYLYKVLACKTVSSHTFVIALLPSLLYCLVRRVLPRI